MADWDAVAAGEDAVLRLYVRDPDRAVVDLALLRLVRGLLPVPRVLDAKTETSADGPPYVLLERLPGINGQVFVDGADEDFEEGYNLWSGDKGGIFTQDVASIVGNIESIVTTSAETNPTSS